MSNKVDKLFKEKLEGHSLQPSNKAWEKVDAHLGKKNRIVLWTRVAAALMLLGLLTFVALNWNNGYEEPGRELVKEESGEGSKESKVKSQVADNKSTEEKSRKQGAGSRKQEAGSKKQEAGSKKQEAGSRKQEASTQHLALSTVHSEQSEEPAEQITVVPELPVESTEVKTISEVKATKGITLTYSLPATKKPTAPAEQLVAEAKKTGFERVIEIAKEVKNGDNPLGELRQAKDDIFAWDFRKDKDKTKKQ